MKFLKPGMQYSDRIIFAYMSRLAASGDIFILCYTDIALDTGIPLRTVQRAIPRLVEAGYITCERPSRGLPHAYKVNHHGNRPERESA